MRELASQNEYALRLKDAALNERLREATQRFSSQLAAERARADAAAAEAERQRGEYEGRLRAAGEAHQVSECESAMP